MNAWWRLLLGSFIRWAPLAVLIVLVSGLVYAAVQQDERSSANDPQFQMATDARTALEQGALPAEVTPKTSVDMAVSLSPFLIIYDAQGQVVASSVTLHGQTPILPNGVLASATVATPDALTWSPEPSVRSAVVVMRYRDGYILAGRSLRIVEQREDALLQVVGAACVVTLALTLLATVLAQWAGIKFAIAFSQR